MIQRTVSEQPIDQGHRSIIESSVVVSPDCRRVAYGAREGDKCLIVVDGRENTHDPRTKRFIRYDSAFSFGCNLVFSPNSKRLAYEVHYQEDTEANTLPV